MLKLVLVPLALASSVSSDFARSKSPSVCEYRPPSLPFIPQWDRKAFKEFRDRVPSQSSSAANAWLKPLPVGDNSPLFVLETPVTAAVRLFQAAKILPPDHESTALEWLVSASTRLKLDDPNMVRMQWLLTVAYNTAITANKSQSSYQIAKDPAVMRVLGQMVDPTYSFSEASELQHLKTELRTNVNGVDAAGDVKTKLQRNYEAYLGKWNNFLPETSHRLMYRDYIELFLVFWVQYLTAATAYMNYQMQSFKATCRGVSFPTVCSHTRQDLMAMYTTMTREWASIESRWNTTVAPAIKSVSQLAPMDYYDVLAKVKSRWSMETQRFTVTSRDDKTRVTVQSEHGSGGYLHSYTAWHELSSGYTCEFDYLTASHYRESWDECDRLLQKLHDKTGRIISQSEQQVERNIQSLWMTVRESHTSMMELLRSYKNLK
ncbi:hypothetical protein RI367_006305 [Sorochytrium milnesiophthora]